MPNPSLSAIRNGLRPTHKVGGLFAFPADRPKKFKYLADQPDGTKKEVTVVATGLRLRNQIGSGHSTEERQARREKRNAESRLRRATKRDFREWFASLSPQDQAFARAHKIDRPMADRDFSSGGEDALDIAESEPIPEGDLRGTRNGRSIIALSNPAIDAIEPQELSVDIDTLTGEEIAAVSEDLAAAIRWALDVAPAKGQASDHQLVQLGRRSAVLIASMREDMAGGLPLDRQLARQFLQSFHDPRLSDTLERLQTTGAVYGRYLEWMRRARDLAGLGERLRFVAYELRPDLIDSATMQTLGEATNKTRQATSKGANCLRDTFAGLRALAQRPDITRLRCRMAQLGLNSGTAEPALA